VLEKPGQTHPGDPLQAVSARSAMRSSTSRLFPAPLTPVNVLEHATCSHIGRIRAEPLARAARAPWQSAPSPPNLSSISAARINIELTLNVVRRLLGFPA
jgi:hypothetical protein